jgi:hypothetical protein
LSLSTASIFLSRSFSKFELIESRAFVREIARAMNRAFIVSSLRCQYKSTPPRRSAVNFSQFRSDRDDNISARSRMRYDFRGKGQRQVKLLDDQGRNCLAAAKRLGRLGNNPQVRPRRFPAAGESLFRVFVRHGRKDDHLIARLPIHGRGDLVPGR